MRKSLVVLALAGALSMTTALTPAFAQARTDVKVGLVLEPPSLDPTAEAAAATDEVVYANIFEGGPADIKHPRLIERYLRSGPPADPYVHYRAAMIKLLSE